MQEALAAHFVRRGLLASCGMRREGTCSPPCGLGDVTTNNNKSELKMARGLLGRAFVLRRAMWEWWRRAFLRVFCNRRLLHIVVRAKIRACRCFSRIIGGVMGCWVSGCRGIRYLTPLLRSPKLLAVLNTPKNARRLEGDLRDKGNRPVEVCIRRGGLCIYPIKDTLRIC